MKEKYLTTSFVLRKKDFQLLDEQKKASDRGVIRLKKKSFSYILGISVKCVILQADCVERLNPSVASGDA